MGHLRNRIGFSRDYMTYLQSFLLVGAVYLIIMRPYIVGDNLIYAIGQIHRYDPTVFSSNVFMADDMISPRYLLDSVFAFFMRFTNGNWEMVAIPFVYFGCGMMILATVRIVFKVCKNHRVFYSGVLAVFLGLNACRSLGMFSTFASSSIGLGTAYALAVFAISFVVGEQKKFNTAWVILAITTLFHIHEGLYGFAAVFLLLLANIYEEKKFSFRDNWCALLCVLSWLVVAIPSLLTDHMTISSQEFVEIYANFRHPHHLVPSAYGIGHIIFSGLTIISSILLRLENLYFYQKERIKSFLVQAGLFLFAWAGALCFTYVFTEVFPVAAVPTLFVPKFFVYVSIMTLLWFLQTAASYIEHREYSIGFTLLAFVLFIRLCNSVIVLLLVFLMIFLFNYWKLVNAIPNPDSARHQPLESFFRGLTVIEKRLSAIEQALKASRLFSIVTCFLCVLLFIGCSYERFFHFEDGRLSVYSPADYMEATAGADICQLADVFQSQTSVSDAFLADPDATMTAGGFQIKAERNCYVLEKVVPSSKSTMKTWYDRYRETTGLFDKDASEIAEIMEAANIQYLLVDNVHYTKMESSGLFDIFSVCDGDSYRIYRLKNANGGVST